MIKIGITGSIASGKSTASKFISYKKGPLFSADKIVKELYAKKWFKRLIIKKFKLKNDFKFKKQLKYLILKNKKTLSKLEKIIHPNVRRKMLLFLKKNKKKKFLFFEIPLLIESNLTKYFDLIIFIRSDKTLRFKRYNLNGGDLKLFSVLNKHQLGDTKKMKFCDHIVVNNKSLSILKKKLLRIIKLYE
tara:strand:+ start:21 stop:587 length:567 start_codon:yes stop_codon:yes gene_type:complete